MRKQEFRHITGDKGVVRTPQFPGQQKGLSIEQVRDIIKNQKRTKGFGLTVGTGESSHDINLSGSARVFLGFSLILETATFLDQPESMQLVINEEIIISQTRPIFFTPDFMDDEYYYFPRPLSGTDDIKVKFINSGIAQTVPMIFYYI